MLGSYRPYSLSSRSRASALFVLLWSCLATTASAQSPPDPLAGRPGLAGPERPPIAAATCENLHAALRGFQPPRTRVDLWVKGPLTLIHSDGALWYLVICRQPGIRVMCVTYSDNGMKPGERIVLRGGFNRQDEWHVLLDPCLATRE